LIEIEIGFEIIARQIVVGTTHLESLESNASLRIFQLEKALEILSAFPTAILTGDFNFHPTWREQQTIPSSWIDCWREALNLDNEESDEKPGYTEDTCEFCL
jgi:endonuclease/exonuclease/phosphatase family metal-dependent hydrolase